MSCRTLRKRPLTNLDLDPYSSGEEYQPPGSRKAKIPRPVNAFMLYANDHRKRLAKKYPQESNKDISIRLGQTWKTLDKEEKDRYFAEAKRVDADHKRKYPDYVYNPKEARLRKAMRDRERSAGAAQMATQRARRSPQWPKPPVHMPPNHGEHIVGAPTKDLCAALRHEMNHSHGFLGQNDGYLYPPQQYQFSPQSDYTTYIQVAPSGWVPNGYMQTGNGMLHQWQQHQQWNQHERPNGPNTYMLNAQQEQHPNYHVDNLPDGNVMQMAPTHKVIPPSDTRYFNSPRGNSTNIQHETQNLVQERQPVEDKSANIATANPVVAIPTDIPPEPENKTNENPLQVHNKLQNEGKTGSNNVDEESRSTFGPIFENETMNAQDLHKSMNKPPIIFDSQSLKMDPIPAHMNSQKSDVPESLMSPYFSMDVLQGKSSPIKQFVTPFASGNNYYLEYLNTDFQSEPSGSRRTNFPIDFSAQKYYESVANGNFDVPMIQTDQFGGYMCDDGYGFLAYPNSQDIQNPFVLSPNQFESGQFYTDPNELKQTDYNASKNDDNCILDLSKVSETDQIIDVGVENCTPEKFVEVSNKICDELAKII